MKIEHNIEFIDAQEMHRKYSLTFDAPSEEELAALKEGDIVEVCVNGKERFWTIIKEISLERISAVVDNSLIYADEFGFNWRDIIQFEKRHIYSIYD